jgi:Carboxypeptidase regulatory-like domain
MNLASLLLGVMLASGTAQQPASQPPAETGPGRVAATITTLQGTINLAGVDVELRTDSDATVLARTTSDGNGQVGFPDVPIGRYILRASRPGFVSADSSPFQVRPGQTAKVLLDIQLTFVLPGIDVRPEEPTPTTTPQPVSMSDILSGPVLETSPLEGDDFQSLLQVLPSVVRGLDGRLRIKGGQPTTGALQVSSASLVDPSTGDFDLELPGQSVETVEVLANPFAAEYGRFSTSITQIHTKRGTNEWQLKPGNLVPRFRAGFAGLRAFEPRFSVHGPLKRDRIFLAEDLQYRYVATPVKSLPDEPEVKLESLDSFTRIDAVISARHTLGGGLILFPRDVGHASMNTFRPPEVTPDFSQSGMSSGAVDRLALSRDVVFETTVSVRFFEVNVNTDGTSPMIYSPQTQRGSFFNDQEREVQSRQLVEALSVSRTWRGEHVLKFGTDWQWSKFTGFSASRPVEVRRLDGSLAERTVFSGGALQDVAGTEFAIFAQDRWRVNSRLTFELGMRTDRDAIVERINYSPRAGVAIGVVSDGRAILRGGFGKFVQRTPFNIEAFPTYEQRTVTRFGVDGSPIVSPITYANILDGDLHTPEAFVGNVEWDQRFGRRLLLKLEFLRRQGSHEYILTPDFPLKEIRLASNGESHYREFEATTRYLGGERRDMTFSYVWARGTADLNDYDQFYGNIRNPILRANQVSLTSTDVRHRLIVRGTWGLPGSWDFSPLLEVRSGFPWSAVNEFQDFVGTRNLTGRLPSLHNLDFTLARPWRVKGRRFRAGLKLYNIFGASAERDVQANTTAPDYGSFYNPIERSIGFVFGSAR